MSGCSARPRLLPPPLPCRRCAAAAAATHQVDLHPAQLSTSTISLQVVLEVKGEAQLRNLVSKGHAVHAAWPAVLLLYVGAPCNLQT